MTGMSFVQGNKKMPGYTARKMLCRVCCAAVQFIGGGIFIGHCFVGIQIFHKVCGKFFGHLCIAENLERSVFSWKVPAFLGFLSFSLSC